MTTISKKHDTLARTTLLSILCLIGVVACKEPTAPPEPQKNTIQIGGADYPVLTIGNRIWTTANYKGAGGQLYKSGTEKPECGRYYTFEEVKAVALPSGWRLPTIQDYIALAESQGVVFTDNRATRQQAIKELISKTDWQNTSGTNGSGFNAYPAGYSFRHAEPQIGYISEFWLADTSTVSIQGSGSSDAHTIMFYKNSDFMEYRFTVRFVKDK